MTSTELARLQRSIEALRQSVHEVQGAYGESPHVDRLVNDLERLEIDARDLAQVRPAVPAGEPGSAEKVVVPDTPYDESLWADADDEGVGGYHGERA